MAVKRGLGRGFESLIPTDAVEAEFDVTAAPAAGAAKGDEIHQIDVNIIDPNPHQPRTTFDQEALEALAASIRVHGILQPLVATSKSGRFELVAGERRLRSAKLAGLKTVPVIVRTFDEQQKLELALIENITRANLNPIETATAYRKLVDQFNLTVTEIAKRVGYDVSSISNTMRLLKLPIDAKRAMAEGKISYGHGMAILSLAEPEKMQKMFELIMKNGWSSSQADRYARGFKGKDGSEEKAHAKLAEINPLTVNLGVYLGTKVKQQTTAKGGKLIIEYYSDEELDRIYKMIRGEED